MTDNGYRFLQGLSKKVCLRTQEQNMYLRITNTKGIYVVQVSDERNQNQNQGRSMMMITTTDMKSRVRIISNLLKIEDYSLKALICFCKYVVLYIVFYRSTNTRTWFNFIRFSTLQDYFMQYALPCSILTMIWCKNIYKIYTDNQ